MALDNFIIHSHYPQEKIVWAYEGVADETNPYWGTIWGSFTGLKLPIPQGINPLTMLIDGVWTNDNWATSYPINCNGRVFGWVDSGLQDYHTEYDEVSVQIAAERLDLSDAIVLARPLFDSSATPEVRLWAYLVGTDMSSYINTKTAEQLQHSLQKTTQLAQLNMISENLITVPVGQTQMLYHNLGFRPFCKIWRGNSADGWLKNEPATVTSPTAPYNWNTIKIDSEKITIQAREGWGDVDSWSYIIRIFNYAIPE